MLVTVLPNPPTGSLLSQLVAQAEIFWAAVPNLVKVTCIPVVGSTTAWNYRFEDTSGRLWKQVIVPGTTNADTTMTFNVTDHWKVAEFSAQRLLRTIIIDILLGGATTVKIEW